MISKPRTQRWRVGLCGMVTIAAALALTIAAVTRADPNLVGEADARDETVASEAARPADVEPVQERPSPSSAALVEPEPGRPGRTPALEHPEALSAFFAALARTAAGQGITRVSHLGDSSIGSDGLPHALRRRFQAEAGDAGPGFVLLQPPSTSYANRTVRLDVVSPWSFCFIVQRCRRDGHYGLGGVTVEGPRGSTTSIRPVAGGAVSRAELWYLAQPHGGRLGVRFGGEEHEIETRADGLEDRWHTVTRERGRHDLRVTALGGGPARAYGVVLENEGPGLVWDTLSMIGAFTHRMLANDEAHFARQLAHRAPDLVVLNYGGNDLRRVVHGRVDATGLEDETHRLLARIRAAVPQASCLVVGINDHRRSGEADVHPRHVETVLHAQRAAAERAGCAFWDTAAAMGGAGEYGAWARAGLASGDGKHLTEAGRRVIAARLYAAIADARGR